MVVWSSARIAKAASHMEWPMRRKWGTVFGLDIALTTRRCNWNFFGAPQLKAVAVRVWGEPRGREQSKGFDEP